MIAHARLLGIGCLLLAGSAVSHARSGGPDSCALEEVKSVGGGLVALGGGNDHLKARGRDHGERGGARDLAGRSSFLLTWAWPS
jgi:hypothetical protein